MSAGGDGLSSLLESFAAGQRTPSIVAAEVLGRVDALASDAHIFIACDKGRLRSEAARADERWASGTARSLEGVPVLIKDNVGVPGFATTGGGRAPIAPSPNVSPLAQRLINAGAIVYGKTNMTEYAFRPHGRNQFFGDVACPGAPGHLAGGSSSGSAAAVRLALCPVALGTDTGGSVRIPAASCGVVGYKPAYDDLSTDGVIALSRTCDHVGVLASRVADLQPLLRVLGSRALGFTSAASRGSTQLRVIVLHDDALGPLAAGPRRAYECAAATLGAAVADPPPLTGEDLDGAVADYEPVRGWEAWRVHGAVWRRDPGAYGAEVSQLLSDFAKVSEAEYRAALASRHRLRERLCSNLRGRALLLVPAMRIAAPPDRHGDVEVGGSAMSLREAIVRFMIPFSLAGVPALVVPVGPLDGGLTGSVQLVGAPGDEHALLAAAARLEAAVGSVSPWTRVSSSVRAASDGETYQSRPDTTVRRELD